MTNTPPDIIENLQWLQPPGAGWSWPVWACFLAVPVLLAIVGWYVLRRRSSTLAFFSPPPHETALRALDELSLKLSEQNQRGFVMEASQIVRIYIQARFGVRAPHRSTEEFLREVHAGDRLLQQHQESLGGFLTGCDLVKFARHQVLLAQMTQLLEDARRFVEATVPIRDAQPEPGRSA